MPIILIIVTFLAGNSWGPMVSMQQLPTSEACAIVMKTAAEAIHGAAQTNVNGNVIIENDNAGGLIIIAGVNRRIMAVIKCS